jgi:hypothetical protein
MGRRLAVRPGPHALLRPRWVTGLAPAAMISSSRSREGSPGTPQTSYTRARWTCLPDAGVQERRDVLAGPRRRRGGPGMQRNLTVHLAGRSDTREPGDRGASARAPPLIGYLFHCRGTGARPGFGLGAPGCRSHFGCPRSLCGSHLACAVPGRHARAGRGSRGVCSARSSVALPPRQRIGSSIRGLE